MRIFQIISGGFAALGLLATTTPAHACACGCGIFDVGDGTVMPAPSDSGVALWARYAGMVQSQLREHGHAADPADNGDKRIATQFYTLGAAYSPNRKWAVMAELPLVHRSFTATDDGTYADPAGTINTRRLTDLGDMTLRLTYTGFASAMTTGLTLGVKLPTGRWHSPLGPLGGEAFDRDTLLGTGSTDLVLGAYHVGSMPAGFAWYAQAQYQFAIASQGGYRPGNEWNGAIGVNHPLHLGASALALVPSLSLIGSVRAHDTGANANPDNSGYARLLIAPGLKLAISRNLALDGLVEFPVAQYLRSADPATGDAGQLTAPEQFRLQVTYRF